MKRLSRLLTTPDVRKHRRFDCEHYDSCLDYAARMNWKSFSCYGCDGKLHVGEIIVDIDGVQVVIFKGRLGRKIRVLKQL